MVDISTLVYNEYFYSILIILATLISIKVLQYSLRKYLRKLLKSTKTDIDDIIVERSRKPIALIIIIVGIYFALMNLSILNEYASLIDKGFFVAFALAIALLVSKIIGVLVNSLLKVKKKFQKTPKLINIVISLLIYLIAFLIILDYFEIEITPMVATLGLGGLAIGLALQSTLSNFFSGLYIISDKPIRIDDFIELEGGVSGYVKNIGWRSSLIQTWDNRSVTIPNTKLAESIIINYDLPSKEMIISVPCGVGYGSDLDKVEKTVIDVVKKIQKTVPGAFKDFEPVVRFNEFGDSNINFNILIKVEGRVNKFIVIHETIKAIKKEFDKKGIEISWPVRKIYYGNKKGK